MTAGVLLLLLVPPLHSQEEHDDATVPTWREDFARLYEHPRDFGHDWRLGSMFGYTPEDGLLLGTGAILYEFGFRTFPYVYRMSLTGGVTIPTLNYKIVYTLLMPALGPSISLDLYAHASALEIRNFYGYGNTSRRDPALEEAGYYRLPSREFWIRPTVYYAMGEQARIGIGLWIRQFRVREADDKILNQAALDSLGDDRATVGLGGQLVLDTRDAEVFPTSGLMAVAGIWHHAGLFSRQSPFQRASADLRFYRGFDAPGEPVLALRLGGEKVWGDPPFYESVFLGGATSLRGFFSQRFAGDAAITGSAELRLLLGRWRILLPTDTGVLLFGDAGRVWFGGASPGPWHADAGAGIWFAPVFRELLVSVSLAKSPEGFFLHATSGFSF